MPLDVGEIDEGGVGDRLFGAQLGELSFGEDDVRLDGGAEIRMTVAHVGGAESFRPQLEQSQQLAGPTQRARRIGPRVLDPDPPVIEDRVIRSQREGQVPLPHQMADIEVKSLAHDLESDVAPVAEADELRERLVDFDMFIHETD